MASHCFTCRNNRVCLLFSYMYLSELDFPASLKWRGIKFFFFYLTQPLPHVGISCTVTQIIVFRLPRNYQLSVKSPQPCESTRTKEARGQHWLTPESQESIQGLSVPIRPLSLVSPLGSCLGSVVEDDAGNNMAAVNFCL